MAVTTDNIKAVDRWIKKGAAKLISVSYTHLGRGKQKVTFKSKDSSNPAKFYINSATAHKEYKTQLITIDGRKGSLKANSFPAGKLEESNDRVINQLIVNNVLEEGPCPVSYTHLASLSVSCLAHFTRPEASAPSPVFLNSA